VLATPQEDFKPTDRGYAAAPEELLRNWLEGFSAYDGPDASVLEKGVASKEWEIKRYDKVAEHSKFGKIYRDPTTAQWWAKDLAGHGGSVWKVFKETATGLEWIADADKQGDYVDKNRGEIGRFIPWKQLSAKNK